jgi:hypothetical protein
VELLAPAQRRLFVDSARFAAEPVNHPLNGGGGRSINDSTSWTPESAVASKPTVNLPDPAMASLKNLTGGTARSLDLGPELVDTPHHTEVERTGRVIRVREYETLGEIAARELGSSTRWRSEKYSCGTGTYDSFCRRAANQQERRGTEF